MSQAQEILNALGGWDNLTDLQHCITRIRVDFKDDSKIDEAALRKAGAFGVVVVGSHAQIVMGPQAEEIAEEINTLKCIFSSSPPSLEPCET